MKDFSLSNNYFYFSKCNVFCLALKTLKIFLLNIFSFFFLSLLFVVLFGVSFYLWDIVFHETIVSKAGLYSDILVTSLFIEYSSEVPLLILITTFVFYFLLNLLFWFLLSIGLVKLTNGIIDNVSSKLLQSLIYPFKRGIGVLVLLLRTMWYIIWLPLLILSIVFGLYLFSDDYEQYKSNYFISDSVVLNDDRPNRLLAMKGPGLREQNQVYRPTPSSEIAINHFMDFLTDNVLLFLVTSFLLFIWVFYRFINTIFIFNFFVELPCSTNECLKSSVSLVKSAWWKCFGNYLFCLTFVTLIFFGSVYLIGEFGEFTVLIENLLQAIVFVFMFSFISIYTNLMYRKFQN